MTYQQHPLSAAFPAMSEEDFQSLKDSIESIGVQNPVTLFEGMVVDGWHRYQAANELGMECPTVDLEGVDPGDFVLAQNKARRHLTQAQLAMAAAAIYRWASPGKPKSAGPAELRQSDVAKKAGVSVRSLRQASKVQDAAPEVLRALESGTVGLEKASAIAQLPKGEQAEALKKPVPKKEPEHTEYHGPSESEIAAAIASTQDDLDTLHKLMESDDKLAAAVAENTKLRAELAVVKLARDGYMNRSNELISRITSLKKQLEKAKAAHV